jgi:2-polyprenyl-3-methyl-5-hydroxy-6-metoxy-1,4-benzoquinol methylase
MQNGFCPHEKCEIVSEIKGIEICKCHSCDLIFTVKENYPDSKEAYENYYKKETGGRFNFGVEYVIKAFRLIRAGKIFLAKPSAKSILDIGSGRGWTLYNLKKYFRYETAVGTQISAPAYEFSKEKLKLEIYNQDLLDIDFRKNFEVITLWHVLEHVSEPEAYLKKIHGLLNNRGLLIIEVPNFNSWTRMLTKDHWLAWDLKHHLTFFTISSLTGLLSKYNFKIKKIRTFSLEYSAFTSAQSIINFITNSDNYFFQWLQAGNFNSKIIWHLLLFVFLLPVCLLINLALFFSKNGEIINIIAEKNE